MFNEEGKLLQKTTIFSKQNNILPFYETPIFNFYDNSALPNCIHSVGARQQVSTLFSPRSGERESLRLNALVTTILVNLFCVTCIKNAYMQHFQSVQSLMSVCKLEKHVSVILKFPKIIWNSRGRGN